ncbi:MAG TPA: hypothetical protein VE988_28125 [Gemmataceae bacterium]|nr:hypothetical protein [Gemmataceae bacterium]
MKLQAAAFVLLGCLAQPASAQVIVGVRTVDVYGSGVRVTYKNGNIVVGSVYTSSTVYGIAPVYPPPYYPAPVVLVPPGPRVIVTGVKYPTLGPGYAPADIRGVDLDLVPLKKPEALKLPEPKITEPEPFKQLPGVDVSKPVPPVRPGDPMPQPKTPPKKPQPPAEPLADPVAEGGRLTDLALVAFQEGDYGVAAQWCRKAVVKAPMLSRAWFLLAQAEFAMGNYRDAVTTIHAGMKIDKQWPRTPIQLRDDLYKGREADFSEHMKRLTESVAANPNHPTLLFLVAHQLWFDGQRKDALALFQRARPLAKDGMFVDAFLAAGGPGQLAAN